MLFVQGLRLCGQAGLVKLGHVSLDGTKTLVNATAVLEVIATRTSSMSWSRP